MKIELITMMYNEEFLAPFFFKHYAFVDSIKLLLDEDSTDRTESIAREFSNVVIEKFKFPNMLDTAVTVGMFRNLYIKSKADWLIQADADEFIFCKDMRKFLEDVPDDIVFVRYFQVYRNYLEAELDPTSPLVGQRRFGDPWIVKGQNRDQLKPTVVRTGKGIHWKPGQHWIWNRHRYTTSTKVLLGQHWCMADPCFCVERRTKGRRDRMSPENLRLGHNIHDHFITDEQIINECKDHLNDMEIFSKEDPYTVISQSLIPEVS